MNFVKTIEIKNKKKIFFPPVNNFHFDNKSFIFWKFIDFITNSLPWTVNRFHKLIKIFSTDSIDDDTNKEIRTNKSWKIFFTIRHWFVQVKFFVFVNFYSTMAEIATTTKKKKEKVI